MNSSLLLLCVLLSTALAGFETFSYGGRSNKLYVPSDLSQKLPLYVMLHGCTQNPTDFATGTKMNTYGENYNLLVLYPEQTSSANLNKCWNWFEPGHQARGKGEPLLISGMVDAVADKYPVDKTRVYVGGLSAGAAMSVIMAVTYPDVFAACAVGAGLEWKAATSVVNAYTAMSSGGPNPLGQGDDAYKTMGANSRKQGILVIHGTSDATVAPVNGNQVIKQFARTNDLIVGKGKASGIISDVPTSTQDGTVSGGRAFKVKNYDNPQDGSTLMKFVEVTSMGHAWSGGSSSGTYTDPKGPDASQIMIDFFSNFPSGVTTGTPSTTSGTTSTGGTGGTTGLPFNGDIVLRAVPSESGWVGMTVLDGYSVDEAKIGSKDGYINDAYRTILSFDTSDVPINATINKAILRIYRKKMDGNVNLISIDLKAGSFGDDTTLGQSDYYAKPTITKLTTIDVPSLDNSHSEVSLPASALQYFQSTGPNGRVSLRLRDPSITVSATANTVFIYGGEAETPAFAASISLHYK